MIATLHHDDDGPLIGCVEAEPECGWDYCDICGECLGCGYPDSPGSVGCRIGRGHLWLLTVERWCELLQAAEREPRE